MQKFGKLLWRLSSLGAVGERRKLGLEGVQRAYLEIKQLPAMFLRAALCCK